MIGFLEPCGLYYGRRLLVTWPVPPAACGRSSGSLSLEFHRLVKPEMWFEEVGILRGAGSSPKQEQCHPSPIAGNQQIGD